MKYNNRYNFWEHKYFQKGIHDFSEYIQAKALLRGVNDLLGRHYVYSANVEQLKTNNDSSDSSDDDWNALFDDSLNCLFWLSFTKDSFEGIKNTIESSIEKYEEEFLKENVLFLCFVYPDLL